MKEVVACLALLLIIAARAHAEDLPVLFEPSTLIVHPSAKTASGRIRLLNKTDKEIEGALSASDFTSSISKKPLGAKVTFEGEPVHALKLPAGKIVLVKLEVANLWEAGESTAELRYNGVAIGNLKALNERVPFAVKLDVDKPDSPELAFESGRRTTLLLRNQDAMTYPVQWELLIGAHSASGEVTLPPNGFATATINPPDDWFRSPVAGLLKRDTREGLLTLRFAPSGSTDRSLARTTVRIKAHLDDYSPGARNFTAYVVASILLLAGGLASLFLNHWVPNGLRRLALQRRLIDLAQKTREIPGYIDSRLRMRLRVERHRLARILANLWAFSPQSSEVFDRCDASITTLEKRIDLVREIDRIHRRLAKVSDRPPTLENEIKDSLKSAAAELIGSESDETTLQSVQVKLAGAKERVEKLGQEDPDFQTRLAKRMDDLNQAFTLELLAEEETVAVRKILPGPFTLLGATAPTVLSNRDYDLDVIKLEQILAYLRLFARADEEHRKRLRETKRAILLKDYLRTNDLEHGWLLIRQMQEHTYAEDVEEGIKKKTEKLTVKMEPPEAGPEQSVRLSALFQTPQLNRSAARERLNCAWDFDDGTSIEEGWEVYHYFPEAGKTAILRRSVPRQYEAKVTFKGLGGDTITKPDGGDVEVNHTVYVQPSRDRPLVGERTKLEIVNLIIALAVALVTLIAGAREQLMKLDIGAGIIAIFLLGFGADTIKNLLTRPQK